MIRNLFITGFLLLPVLLMSQQREEMIPYGDMDQWIVRYIHESKLLGGATKTLYAIGPTDTIHENGAYVPIDGNPWGCSNTYAKWIVETAAGGAVQPEPRLDGYACRMENKIERINFGDMHVMVTGSIFFGQNLEPAGIVAKSKPFTIVDFGVPFTEHPVALRLDYKAKIEDSDSVTSTVHNKPEQEPGRDHAEVFVFLQHRWEDPKTGKIYARRVGTASERIYHDIPEWINNHDIPIRWGDITNDSLFHSHEQLNKSVMMARNSQGKMVEIEEVGFGLEEPTHAILQISSSCAGVFRAHEGNILWVDNLRWVYNDSTNTFHCQTQPK